MLRSQDQGNAEKADSQFLTATLSQNKFDAILGRFNIVPLTNGPVRKRGRDVANGLPAPTVDIELKWTAWSCRFFHTLSMTTKTIPEYLEDERRKDSDAQLRLEEEAARIQLLNHGHHRTAKQPKLELPSVVKPAPKARKTAAQARKPHTTRETATKARKAA